MSAGQGRVARAGAATPAILAAGFRPFFLLAGLHAAIAVPLWLAVDRGIVPLAHPAPLLWHGHEMLFGFVVAAVAGFLLTAVPNWTGLQPIRGRRLALLVGLWLAGRAAWWGAGLLPAWLVAVADLPFLPVLGAFVVRDLVATRQFRNLVMVAALAVLLAGNLLVHLETLGLAADLGDLGLRLGTYVVLLLLVLIGGRIVPAFTASAFNRRGLNAAPSSHPWLDRAAILAVVVFALVDLTLPQSSWSGYCAAAAALLHAVRLAGWRPARTRHDPLLWALHCGYAWVPIGFALSALGDLAGLLPRTLALHAFTAGAFGSMILAVMTRAALGHTGRPLVAPPAAVFAYVLVAVAAALRALVPAVAPGHYQLWLLLAGVCWSLAFASFALAYWSILTRPRADGRPG